MLYLPDYIGLPATLEHTAEECSELAKAALKVARIIRKENPTPDTLEGAMEHLYEETADVQILINHILQLPGAYDAVKAWERKKVDRLAHRLGVLPEKGTK